MGITDDELIGTFQVRKRFGWSTCHAAQEGGGQSRHDVGERPRIRAERHSKQSLRRAPVAHDQPRPGLNGRQLSLRAMRCASRRQLLAASPEVRRVLFAQRCETCVRLPVHSMDEPPPILRRDGLVDCFGCQGQGDSGR